MTDYRPIACGLYDRFEIAIVERRRLRVVWAEAEGVERCESLLPTGLETDRGEEFLLAEGVDGEVRRLRLDRIRAFG